MSKPTWPLRSRAMVPELREVFLKHGFVMREDDGVSIWRHPHNDSMYVEFIPNEFPVARRILGLEQGAKQVES